MKCKHDLGKFKSIIVLENYNHIMSRKIRIYKIKKQFESIGVVNPLQAAIDYDSYK